MLFLVSQIALALPHVDVGSARQMRCRSLLHRKMAISNLIIGADCLRIFWCHKNNTPGGDHAATSQISYVNAAGWPTPLPGMRAADVSCLH